MSARRRVGLLYGGRSVEHEISVISARGVAAACREGRLDCVPIGVTGEGRWLSPERSLEILGSDATRAEPPAAADDGSRLVPDPGAGRLLRLVGGRAPEPIELEVLFPLIHGWGGEDGRLQGLLELTALPCVGAGVLGSAAAMDKVVAKRLFEAAGLPVLAWRATSEAEYRRDAASFVRQVLELDFPVFVKPANGGSSVGISRVDSPESLGRALERAFECDRRVLVEAGIGAREIEVAVIGNDDPQASVPGEIIPSGEFYDYAAKYLDGKSRLLIPAPLGKEPSARISKLALEAYRALDLCGFARVDFLLDRRSDPPTRRSRTTEGVYLNEINTLPGFTPISMFPKLWEASGLAYPRLIERLVDLALERWRSETGKRTRWEGEVSGQASG